MILPIIAVGMIPCPGAVIILLFSISMDVLKIGIILALIMALGMAVTISSVGVLTIIVKQGVLKFVSGRNRVGDIFQAATGIIGSLLILLLGAFLFIGSI
jgi:ABC-type nickel/cobalt efflux system permease component RcnA